MLEVLEMEQVYDLLKDSFMNMEDQEELVVVSESYHRILAEDIRVRQNFPMFERSCVDGYAVKASDVFGCSDSLPSILTIIGSVEMGKKSQYTVEAGQCVYVPTGAEVPVGADAMVMIEYIEDYHDGTIGVCKGSPPGEHIIFIGDDAKTDEILIKRGSRIGIKEIGALSAVGIDKVKVKKRIKAGIISSGNEIIPPVRELEIGEIYDANGPMIYAALDAIGCEAHFMGIVKDEYEEMKQLVLDCAKQYDVILISGGTSVGRKDLTVQVLEELGEELVHGIAVKPGKPTIIGRINEKPFFGLPGNPVASFFILNLLVIRFLKELQGETWKDEVLELELDSQISSNHGREECIAVRIEGNKAVPMSGKSGLIMMLTKADGYIRVGRNCEGLPKNSKVLVHRFL